MADLPLVSVVIPAYNHARFVKEAVRSVLAQSMGRLELIVVDDGSTDETAVVAQDAFASDPRARLISQRNAGSHAAIRTGLDAARAPWLAILNSDDCWAEQRLDRLLAAMTDGGQWAFTGVRLIDAMGAVIQDTNHWWHRTQRDFQSVVSRVGPLRGLLYGNYAVSTSNFFFHRSVLTAAGMPKPLKMIPDWEWALRMAHTVPDGLRYLADDKLLDYRLHGGNTIMSHFMLGDCEVSRMHRSILSQQGVPPELVNAVFRNQRDLRRHWRALGVEPAQAHVRQRETEVRQLSGERDEALAFLAQRDGQLSAVTRERDEALAFLAQRDGQLLTVTQERDKALAFLAQRDAQLLTVTQERDEALAFLAQRDGQLLAVTQERDEALAFLAQRDGQLLAVTQERDHALAVLGERDAQFLNVTEERDTALSFLAQRETDVAALTTERDRYLAFVREREVDVARLQDTLRVQQDAAVRMTEQLDQQREWISQQAALLQEAESSWWWRRIRWIKRRWGLRRF